MRGLETAGFLYELGLLELGKNVNHDFFWSRLKSRPFKRFSLNLKKKMNLFCVSKKEHGDRVFKILKLHCTQTVQIKKIEHFQIENNVQINMDPAVL